MIQQSIYDTNHCELVNLNDLKKDGLAPNSRLLWALLPKWVMWIGLHKSRLSTDFRLFREEPTWHNEYGWGSGRLRARDIRDIVINYSGTMKESLTKRPEGC